MTTAVTAVTMCSWSFCDLAADGRWPGYCTAHSRPSRDTMSRWARALKALDRYAHSIIPDEVWDAYLDARAAFLLECDPDTCLHYWPRMHYTGCGLCTGVNT